MASHKIQLLEEYRKRYETPFEGVDSIIKNRVRLHYLHNVDHKISQVLLEESTYEKSESAFETISMHMYFNGTLNVANNDGEEIYSSGRCDLYDCYEQMLEVNEFAAKHMIVTPARNYMDIVDEQLKTFACLDWMLDEYKPALFKFADPNVIKAKLLSLFERKKFDHFYSIVPKLMLSHNRHSIGIILASN